MRRRIRQVLIGSGRVLAVAVSLLPGALRRGLVSGFIFIESRIGSPEAALKRLFAILDDMQRIIDERAMAYEGGLHPKHRLTRYHDFFVERIPPGSRVLDVGCGVGAVAKSVAERVPDVIVLGVDKDNRSIERARNFTALPNLSFVAGDATVDLPPEHWDVIVLSNILEHVGDRVALLKALVRHNSPRILLIRVPLFERHWHIPMRRELDVDYFSDPTHQIEHTLVEFETEMEAAGLMIVERQTEWGEIWARCEPESEKA